MPRIVGTSTRPSCVFSSKRGRDSARYQKFSDAFLGLLADPAIDRAAGRLSLVKVDEAHPGALVLDHGVEELP